jgi:hypothetical protein
MLHIFLFGPPNKPSHIWPNRYVTFFLNFVEKSEIKVMWTINTKEIIMNTMLNRGKELLRICPTNAKKLEYSINDGRSWIPCYLSSSAGEFIDLIDHGDEILATTDKGLFVSTNGGRAWIKRRS